MPLAVGSGGDSIWTDVGGTATYEGNTNLISPDGNTTLKAQVYDTEVGRLVTNGRLDLAGDRVRILAGGVSQLDVTNDGGMLVTQDLTINGVKVGIGGVGGNAPSNTVVGKSALSQDTLGANTAVGYQSLQNCTGSSNTAIGKASGSSLNTGSYNILIGENAQPSAPDVNGEVTIGDDNVTKFKVNGVGVNFQNKGTYTQHQVYSPDRTNLYRSELSVFDSGSVQLQAVNSRLDLTGDTNIRMMRNGLEQFNMNIEETTFRSAGDKLAIRIAPNGHVRFPETLQFPTTGPANVYIDSNGRIHKAATSAFSAEEIDTAIDKKLAVKDKLIEKLSARLDKLEKRMKK
jgi:hypothetical protein